MPHVLLTTTHFWQAEPPLLSVLVEAKKLLFYCKDPAPYAYVPLRNRRGGNA